MTTAAHTYSGDPNRIPKRMDAIRSALPADQRAAFDGQRDTLDMTDLATVAAFRDRWWARAVLAQDDELDADADAAMAGTLELVEAWQLGDRSR